LLDSSLKKFAEEFFFKNKLNKFKVKKRLFSSEKLKGSSALEQRLKELSKKKRAKPELFLKKLIFFKIKGLFAQLLYFIQNSFLLTLEESAIIYNFFVKEAEKKSIKLI